MTAKLMEFIALDDQPFSVVEDVGFRRLLEHLEPRCTSRRYFSDVALPQLHSLVATRVHKLIKDNVSAISLTTDIWTSDVSPISILSLTAQWIDNNFELQKAVLHAQECSGSHTSAALSMAFENMFETWKISKENIHIVLRVNARNIAKAMVECRVPSLPCMAHTLQLAVNDGVLSQRRISYVIAVSRRTKCSKPRWRKHRVSAQSKQVSYKTVHEKKELGRMMKRRAPSLICTTKFWKKHRPLRKTPR